MDDLSESPAERRARGALNEHGLFVHPVARSAIDAFVSRGLVGAYPLYLVGMVLPEHCCGPAVVALLTLPDGGVLDANARSLTPVRRRKLLRGRPERSTRVNGVLERDVQFLNTEELERYRRIFYDRFGGFSAPCLETSPTAAAESMVQGAPRGPMFGAQVGPSAQGPPSSFPSDWTDVVYYSQRGVGCTVEGFAPEAHQLDDLDVSEALARSMQLAKPDDLKWLYRWSVRLEAEFHPHLPGLIEEAWAVRRLSPRASVALLRTAAELVVAGLGVGRGNSFYAKLRVLEDDWTAKPLGGSPQDRAELAWRADVLACLHIVRDLGNRIHADSVVGQTDVDRAHAANRRLLEAVLRAGPLDVM